MRNLLKEILTNFTFLEGCILSGKDFNNVNKDKPIAFTIWKFGGKTKHLDLEFECNGRIIKLDTSQRNFDLLKNGWRYKEKSTQNTLYVGARDCFNEPCLPTFTSISSGTGARVIRQNVKKKISFDNSFDKFPSELIYALWSIIFGNKRITPPIVVPLAFNEAYTHIPKDFNNSDCQKILLCSSLWVFIKEIGTLVEGKIKYRYTDGKIGFTSSNSPYSLKFGNQSLTNAIKYLLKKYENEPIQDVHLPYTIIKELVDDMQLHYNTNRWDDCRKSDVRKFLQKWMSELLNKIGYWDKIIVEPVDQPKTLQPIQIPRKKNEKETRK